MNMLELCGITKTYGADAAQVRALDGVDLVVEPGIMVAVMGPSGSGKSSLLTIAGGLERPSAGRALVDGGDLAEMSRSALARLRRRTIGYVFQDYNLLPGLNAVENVALPLELDGVPAKAAQRSAPGCC
jgi:putative ABC transport system ATP-binding protein